MVARAAGVLSGVCPGPFHLKAHSATLRQLGAQENRYSVSRCNVRLSNRCIVRLSTISQPPLASRSDPRFPYLD